MKRALVLFLTLSILFLFIGCANDSTIQTNEANGNAMDSETEVPLQTPPIPTHQVIQKNQYSEDGLIISETYFELNDTNTFGKTKEILYAYDENNISSVIALYPDGTKEMLESYAYNDIGQLVEVEKNGHIYQRFFYDDKGNCIKKLTYDSREKIIDSEIRTYNESDISSIEYYSLESEYIDTDEGETIEVESETFIFEEYDDNGRITKITYHYPDERPYYDEYTYEGNIEIIRTYTFSKELVDTLTLTFDENGRKIRHEYCSESGASYLYTYEHTSNSSTSYSHEEGAKVIKSKTEYLNEKKVAEYAYDEEGNFVKKWLYEYDENDYLISTTEVDASNQTVIQTAPEREYYENGNIKTETFYDDMNYIAPAYLGKNPFSKD